MQVSAFITLWGPVSLPHSLLLKDHHSSVAMALAPCCPQQLASHLLQKRQQCVHFSLWKLTKFTNLQWRRISQLKHTQRGSKTINTLLQLGINFLTILRDSSYPKYLGTSRSNSAIISLWSIPCCIATLASNTTSQQMWAFSRHVYKARSLGCKLAVRLSREGPCGLLIRQKRACLWGGPLQ